MGVSRYLACFGGLLAFCSTLRRDVLCIPYFVFHFIEENEGKWVKPCDKVKRELLAMGSVAPLLFYSFKSKFALTAFATDAMGENDIDSGGYGVVARKTSLNMLRDALESGGAPGFTVSRLSGDMTGTKYPNKLLSATKPFSLLHEDWFINSEWLPVTSGRWKYSDSIVLGESRTGTKAVSVLSNFKGCRDHKVITLQDNRPVSGASAKGRSSSFPLNRSLRRRASLLLSCSLRLLMPWVESARQPADELSRIC